MEADRERSGEEEEREGYWREDAFRVRCINQDLQRASNGKVESRASSESFADSLLASSGV